MTGVFTTVAVVGLVVMAIVARRWLRVVAVRGSSMSPTYPDGSRLVAVFPPARLRSRWRVRAGQVVVCDLATWLRSADDMPLRGLFVKRVVAGPGDRMDEGVLAQVMNDWRPEDRRDEVPAGSYVVLGDDPSAADSRVYGFMPSEALRGVALRSRREA